MKFLDNVKNSLYNPDFYGELKHQTVGSSVKYFYFLAFILSFIVAFVVGNMLSPLYSTESLKRVASYYPAELTLSIKSGVISTNVSEPYIIKSKTLGIETERGHLNAVVIDTRNSFTRELFEQYDTNVWVGKDFVVTAKDSSRFELTDMSQVHDLTLNQEKLFSWADIIGGYHLAISLSLFALLLIAFLSYLSAHLILFFITSLLVLGIVKLKKIELSYKNCYQIVLHAATVPLILETVFILSGVVSPFPFFFSLILLIIVFVNLKPARELMINPVSKA